MKTNLKVFCMSVCMAAVVAAAADVCRVTMLPDEHWWGVCNSFGTNMPFTNETCDFKADLFAASVEKQRDICA